MVWGLCFGSHIAGFRGVWWFGAFGFGVFVLILQVLLVWCDLLVLVGCCFVIVVWVVWLVVWFAFVWVVTM